MTMFPIDLSVEERKSRIIALARDDISVLINVDITRGYPKATSKHVLQYRVAAGVADLKGTGYDKGPQT